MPDHFYSQGKPNLAFAKLVANPTETSWSQVYNAGNLFICFSLTQEEEPEENESLQAIGKNIFNTLETEFFTLEEKSLTGIKDAILRSIKHIPPALKTSLCLAYFKDTILYIFIVGAGKIIMERNNKIAVLLEKSHGADTGITSASGYLHNHDTVILETKQFANTISESDLRAAFELALPNDIAEALSPQIHSKEDGGQAAIVIAYNGTATAPTVDKYEESEEEIPEESFQPEKRSYEPEPEKKNRSFRLSSLFHFLPKLHLPSARLSHKKKLFLSIVIILIGILITSIFMAKKNQENTAQKALFESVYTPAQKKYDEGKELDSLNANLSKEDYQKAKDILEANKDKFKDGSPEKQQILALLQKVDAELGGTGSDSGTSAKEASVDETNILAIEKTIPGALSAAQDDNAVYVLTAKSITKVDKTTGKKKEIIKNNGDWKSPVSIATYQGNLYVLDQKNGIIKYLAGSDGYGKTSYFTKQPSDISQAVAMAIDSSVYTVNKNGTIHKYTRGAPDDFSISGLETQLTTPLKIFTNAKADNVYVLDKGNRSVVQFSKDGAYEKTFKASVIVNAVDFEVQELNDKILILSGNKVWEIGM